MQQNRCNIKVRDMHNLIWYSMAYSSPASVRSSIADQGGVLQGTLPRSNVLLLAGASMT